MADRRPQALYNCSQNELYAICMIGWASYTENQPDSEAFNTLYTALASKAPILPIPKVISSTAKGSDLYGTLGKHIMCVLFLRRYRE